MRHAGLSSERRALTSRASPYQALPDPALARGVASRTSRPARCGIIGGMTETLGVLGFALSLVLAFNQLWRERPDLYVNVARITSRVHNPAPGAPATHSEPEEFEVHVVNLSNRPIVVADMLVDRASLRNRQMGYTPNPGPSLPRRMDTNDLIQWHVSVAEFGVDRTKPVVVSVRYYARRYPWARGRSRMRTARSNRLDLSDKPRPSRG